METKTGRRGGVRSMLVEPYRQVKLGLMFLLVNIIFGALIFAVFGYYVRDMYEAFAGLIQLTQAETTQILEKFYPPIVAGAVLILAFIGTTLLVSVRYTHQIYGPLVSIQRFLDELLGGKRPQSLSLRHSDQLKELATKLNGVAEIMAVDQRGGPMIAINKFLDQLAAGENPERLQLRDDDNYTELATRLNKLADQITSGSSGNQAS